MRGVLNGHGMVKYPDGRMEYAGDPLPELMRTTIEAYLRDGDPIDTGNGLPPEPESIPDDDVVEQLTPWMTPIQADPLVVQMGPLMGTHAKSGLRGQSRRGLSVRCGLRLSTPKTRTLPKT